MIKGLCEICAAKQKIYGFHQQYVDVNDDFNPLIKTWLIMKCTRGHEYKIKYDPVKKIVAELNKQMEVTK